MMFFSKKKYCSSAKYEPIFDAMLMKAQIDVDCIFAKIFVVQWIFGVLCALLISPMAWRGSSSSVHIHVWAAIFLGGTIASVPLLLIAYAPGRRLTRVVVATGQMLFSVLLIHLMGGRIEAHFHVFVSLALLAAYRDRTIFLPAVATTVVDHIVRGFFWPQSVFGVLTFDVWRPFEHGAWAIFETTSLGYLIGKNLVQLGTVASLQCSLQDQRDELERKVTERTWELQNAKNFQESILNSIDAEICVLDQSGELVFVNERWKEFCELNEGDLKKCGIATNYIDVCDQAGGPSSSFAKEVAQSIRDVRDGKIASYVNEYPCHHGNNKRWFHVRINPVQLNGVAGVAVVHIDVTETKKAQSRAESFAKLVLNSPNELFIASKESLRFVEVNHGSCENLGYDRETLLKMSAVDLHPDISEEQVRELLHGLLTGQTETLSLESTHQRKDGSTYQCSINLHNSILEDEEVIVAFVTDISHRKQLEQQLAQAQKLESVGQLAAGVAHEINTPMQCVFGNVEFLNNSFEKMMSVSDHVVALLEKNDLDWRQERQVIERLRVKCRFDYLSQQIPMAIQEAAEASTKVIAIIRAMKIMSHPGSVAKTPTDIHDMLLNAAMITASRWKYVAEMEYEFDPQLHEVDILPAEMTQVFINMIVNAGDAISEKTGKEPTELGKIKIKTGVEKDLVEISFSDTGAGMSDAVRKRIFDPFFTTKEVGRGTGQGLSIAHNVIVNLHSGSIDVQSIEGVGTTFRIRIPRFPVSDPGLPKRDGTLLNDAFSGLLSNTLAVPCWD
jgi:two-component system, NtrC family, sensor kinase